MRDTANLILSVVKNLRMNINMGVGSNVHAIAVAAAVAELAGGVVCIEIRASADTTSTAEETARTYLQAGATEVWLIGVDGTRVVFRTPGAKDMPRCKGQGFVDKKISIEEAALYLECNEQTVMAALRDGVIPGIKIGKPWVIPREAFFSGLSDLAVREAEKLRVSKVFTKPKPNPVPKEQGAPSPPTRGRPRFPRTF